MITIEIPESVIPMVQEALKDKENEMKGDLGTLANASYAEYDMQKITATVDSINNIHGVIDQIEVKKGMAGIA